MKSPPGASGAAVYPSPFTDDTFSGSDDLKTLLELELNAFTGSLRRKPDWQRKVNDQEIVAKWQAEAAEQGLGTAMFEIAMQQLKFFATLGVENDLQLSPVLDAFESDTIMSNMLRLELLEAIRVLEEVSPGDKDWHPGSNNQVLDLVHPSLWCAISGKTRHLSDRDPRFSSWRRNMGRADEVWVALPAPRSRGWRSRRHGDHRYQWLPADVRVEQDGSVKFKSYVNNLHPEWHAKLYSALAHLLSGCLPLLEAVLAKFIAQWPNTVQLVEWKRENEELGGAEGVPGAQGGDAEAGDGVGGGNDAAGEDDEDDDDEWSLFDEARHPWGTDDLMPALPEQYTPPGPLPAFSLKGRDIQVIVKIAEIVLTPDNPSYPGGTWHVEGTVLERIVASTIVYLHSENITESVLKFRRAVPAPEYEQNDEVGPRKKYGIQDEHPLVQPAGHVECKQGRCICFPNSLQHCVAPFELEDKSRSGVRKIVCFFLVNPEVPVLSTGQVPPQQAHWHTAEARLDSCIPSQFVQKISNYMEDFPFGMPCACKEREELMAQRTTRVEMHKEDFLEPIFSLCEH